MRRLKQTPLGTEIITGGAPGADWWAAETTRRFGGFKLTDIRNIEMLDLGPDLVIAFWDGASRGTLHTMTEARKRGIPVEVIKGK